MSDDFRPPPTHAPGVGIGSNVSSGVPQGDPATAWRRRKDDYRLVSPLNRRKFRIVVVGTGLAGAGQPLLLENWDTTSMR